MTPDDWKLLGGILVGVLAIIPAWLTLRKSKEQFQAEIERARADSAKALADAAAKEAEADAKRTEIELKFKAMFFTQIDTLTTDTRNLEKQIHSLKDQVRDLTIKLDGMTRGKEHTEQRVQELLEKCGNCVSCGCPCPACRKCTGQKRNMKGTEESHDHK